MRTLNLTKSVSVRYEADVVVVGGGVAGSAAAIAAGRQGKSVLLIEASGCLGGLATNGHVSPFDATESRSGKTFGGIGQEIIDRMVDAQLNYGVPSSIIKREGPHLFKWVLLKMAVESGVRILFHSTLVEVIREDNEIKNLIINTKSGLEGVSGKMFIDATGDGDVLFGAGEEYFMGSEQGTGEMLSSSDLDRMHYDDHKFERYTLEHTSDRHAVQPCSVMFTMGGVDLSQNPTKYNNKNLSFEDLGIDREEFKKLPYYGAPGFEDNGDLIPMPQGRILLSYTGRPGELLVNMSRIIGVDATDAVELSEAAVKAHLQVMHIVDFLKRYVPGFENSFLVESSNVLGVRETRRLVGQYVLKGSDAINCVHFDDNIGCGSYMIDIHDPFGKARAIGGDVKGDCYGIPYRSIVPKTVKNLLVSGRCISADHVTHASTRIQGTCVITGQAAGTAASVALDSDKPVQTIDVKELQSRLRNAGCVFEF